MAEEMQRNLALELARVTEAAAMAAVRWMGRGDKNGSDQAAVDAMRSMLDRIDMDGVVVIGEGEKDEAPMLYVGEELGTGRPPRVDIAVDPIDGTRLLALGMPGAIAVLALAERGSMYSAPPGVYYMNKIAVGRRAKGAIDITASVAENIASVSRALDRDEGDITIMVLDRPRHEQLIKEIRATSARVRLIPDGDVAGAITAAEDGTGVDMLMGSGGAPEAVIAACALKAMGGDMQCKLFFRDDEERKNAEASGVNVNEIFGLNDLVKSDDAFFAATGITNGELLHGVRYGTGQATTESVVMRSRSGTIRYIRALHQREKLSRIGGQGSSENSG
ncbi:MAG TPA: class II fructose-bisphosphatase [Chloroflexia bacterium]|nr:class II fructose-bisphosphatase [Chloroflexia bacterium]